MEKEKEYKMNDLISREALKEHKFPIPLIGDYQQGWNDAIDAIYDNADTVKPTFGLFRSIFCETCQAYSSNIARVYTEELEATLAKIEEIARDAFNDPETLDINLYRAQALAKIYQMFIYDTKEA